MPLIVAGVNELERRIGRLMRELSPENRIKALMEGGKVVERHAKLNVRKQHLIDTGNLRNSITATPEGNNAVVIGPGNVVYAAIHEFGGTITPKQSKFLAIPITSEAKMTSPRNFSGLRFVPNRGKPGGTLRDAGGTVHYILVQNVVIPARPYMRPALDENKREIENAIIRRIQWLIENAMG